MANESPDFPYKTFLNILHGPLEKIDVQQLIDRAPTNGGTRPCAR